jgi:pilus assembly protein CpaB
MRTGTNFLILLLALVMGGAAAFLARDWLASHAGAPVAQAPSTTVVIASTALGFGAPITPDSVTEVAWPADLVPDGAFTTVKDMLKDGRRVVVSPLSKTEPVLRSKVTEPGQRGSLSALIEEGKRAVTVSVDDVRGVAGFIFPGDYVDVVLTRTTGNDQQSYSEVILQHVKVLAIDQLAGNQQEKPTIAKAVTVELTAEQSLKVLLATNVGRLSLILRQTAENELGPKQRVTESDLFTAEAAPTPAPPPPAPAPAAAPAPVAEPVKEPLTKTVTIVRGTKPEEYAVIIDKR